MNMITRLINRFKIWSYKRSIKELEIQIMFFEIPYDLAITKIEWLEHQIEKLNKETKLQ